MPVTIILEEEVPLEEEASSLTSTVGTSFIIIEMMTRCKCDA
jgi:hypothetical protein